jgi:hypothetical protein
MDINSIKTNNTAVVKIVDPLTLKPNGVKVEVYNASSKEVRKISSSLRKKKLDEEEFSLTLLASCVVSWENLTEKKRGKDVKVPLTVENAKRVFELLPWMASQIDSFSVKGSNFLERVEDN